MSIDITYSELNRANEMLFKFVSEVEDLYGIGAMSFNGHQLLHICKSVYNWGPLWAHSAFSFESANHNLLTAIHCAKGVILQVLRYLNLQRAVQILKEKVYPKCTGVIQVLRKSCEERNSRNVKINFYHIFWKRKEHK